ncbi:MAG TPA: flagellar hook-length control protein FliK [Candidatus Binatia bacterium]|nr:flagellar hook-length control protein FliK [Candidatus Binatia bacterium]
MNVNATSLDAKTLLDGNSSEASVEPANVEGREFATLLSLIFGVAGPAQPIIDPGASPFPGVSQELSADPQSSRAAQVGGKAAAVDPAARESLDNLKPASEKSLEQPWTALAPEMGISQSIRPMPEGRELEEGPPEPGAGTDDNRTLDNVAHAQRSLTRTALQPPYRFAPTVLINEQGARAGEPQQLFGDDPEAAHRTSLPQASNSHDAAQPDRQANPKDPSRVVQNGSSAGDAATMRHDSSMTNVTVERTVTLNSKKDTEFFQPGRNDQLVQGWIMEHSSLGPNRYPGNAPGQHLQLTRAENGQPFEPSPGGVEADLHSQGILHRTESVSSTPATNVWNEKQNSSYPQNPRDEAGETFQTNSERSEGGRDAGPVHFVHTTDRVPATSAREPQDRNWHPVIDRVAGEISGRIHIGKQEAVLQLDPAELGKLQIDLHMEGDRLVARILTETPESRALIEAHLPELRQALVENRVELVEIRIDHGSWDGQRGEGQKPQQETGGWLQTAHASGEVRPRAGDEQERARPASVRLEAGRVSMWA